MLGIQEEQVTYNFPPEHFPEISRKKFKGQIKRLDRRRGDK